MTIRLAYFPMVTYPDPAPESSVKRSVEMASVLGAEVQANAFGIQIPRVSTPVGGLLINIPEMIRTAEDISRKHCEELVEWARRDAAQAGVRIECNRETVAPGEIGDLAASQARYFDVSLLSLHTDNLVMREVAEAIIFGSGRPSILLPQDTIISDIEHIAVAWDGSRVAARALADAQLLLSDQRTRITVFTVADEKPLGELGIAETLAASLERRGVEAHAVVINAAGSPIATVLQDHAREIGAKLLVMGGYGHSRLRDFVLGGATRGVLTDLRLPVLLSH